MTDNIPVRAATSPELAKFRGSEQFSKLNLAIHDPGTMYNARINQTFDSIDGVAEFIYDGGSGLIENVKPGMLVFVSAVNFGQREKGICRVRKAIMSDTFYINETSDIQFAQDDYITVLDSFSLWPRDITETGGTVLMDYDIEFGSSLAGGVIPRIGPMVSVLELTGATVTFSPVDPSLSASYDGTTIVSYLYACAGASATSGLDTTSPTFTFNAAGQYRWSCTITDSNNRETTAYRWVFVNPAQVDFDVTNISGDYDSGDWSFTVTLYDDVTKDDIYERAMITLYAKDYYAGTFGSIGKLAGYENIICTGWVDGESIEFDSEKGSVTFTVRGAAYWLDKIRAFPFEVMDTAGAPANWKQITTMTVDKALAHILYWTSTAPQVMDIFFTGDTNRIKVLAQPGGSLLNQINAIAENTLFAKPLVNNLGQMFIEIDQQLIPYADRAALPVVMDITTADYMESLEIERNTSSKTSMVEFSADTSYNGTTVSRVYSRAPGRVGKLHGTTASYNNYVIADQDEANRMSGDLLAMGNYELSAFDLSLAMNNRLIDICPRQYVTMSISAADNPRGIALSTARMIPRKVTYTYDKETGTLLTSGTFELETIGVPGVTYTPVEVGTGEVVVETGGGGEWPIDGGGEIIDIEWPEVTTPCSSAVANSVTLGWSITDMRGEDSATLSSKVYYPCKIRATGGIYGTSLAIGGTWKGDANNHYAVYGFKGGARVITASITHNAGGNTATFSPVSDTEIDGFEIALESGVGALLDFVPGEILSTGTVAATVDINPDSYSLTTGEYYAVNAWGGPWRHAPDWPDVYSILVSNGARNTGVPGIGLSSIDGATTNFYLNLGTLGVYAYALNSLYGLIIFQASEAGWGVVVDDFVKDNNVGSIGYTLRSVAVEGRRILLGGVIVNNVCV